MEEPRFVVLGSPDWAQQKIDWSRFDESQAEPPRDELDVETDSPL